MRCYIPITSGSTKIEFYWGVNRSYTTVTAKFEGVDVTVSKLDNSTYSIVIPDYIVLQSGFVFRLAVIFDSRPVDYSILVTYAKDIRDTVTILGSYVN